MVPQTRCILHANGLFVLFLATNDAFHTFLLAKNYNLDFLFSFYSWSTRTKDPNKPHLALTVIHFLLVFICTCRKWGKQQETNSISSDFRAETKGKPLLRPPKPRQRHPPPPGHQGCSRVYRSCSTGKKGTRDLFHEGDTTYVSLVLKNQQENKVFKSTRHLKARYTCQRTHTRVPSWIWMNQMLATKAKSMLIDSF